MTNYNNINECYLGEIKTLQKISNEMHSFNIHSSKVVKDNLAKNILANINSDEYCDAIFPNAEPSEQVLNHIYPIVLDFFINADTLDELLSYSDPSNKELKSALSTVDAIGTASAIESYVEGLLGL
ncbi:MAG: hypothetical protein K0R94_1440 [Burkholderiales bacterium]|jgi:hypothetical protein|nr:hypothetical protein [Burkholderiales bacterium]